MKLLRVIAIALAAVLVLAAIFVFLSPAAFRMKLLSGWFLGKVRDYRWEELLDEDPVKASLQDALGEDKPRSCEALYDLLKEETAQLSWEYSSADAKALTTEYLLTYPDATPFLDAYAEALADWFCAAILDGRLSLEELSDPLGALPDDENCSLIAQARSAGVLSGTKQSTVTISFRRSYGIPLPCDASEGLYDAVTAGLYSSMDGLTETVTALLIPRLLNGVLEKVRSFDLDSVQRITGMSIDLSAISFRYPALADAITTFIAQQEAELQWSLGSYDPETGTISVELTYTDCTPVIKAFSGAVARYVVTHLFSSPIPGDAELAELFTQAAGEQSYGRVAETVEIHIDPLNGSFSAGDRLADILTGNLYSSLGALVQAFTSLLG